jgi:formylglycine-generating enzyme required for sulfatase activity
MKKTLFLLLTGFILTVTLDLRAQTTAFTYQGRLNDGTNPANGSYDLRFTLFPSSGLGSSIAGPLTNSATSLSNGLFTVLLDFGGSPFTGQNLWLEIAVRTNGSGSFATLSPRQRLTPAPYSIGASSLLAPLTGSLLQGTYPGSLTLNNAANQLSGIFTGNGANMTNVNAALLGGLASSNFWKTTGNAGTTPGINYVGTTDGQPLLLNAPFVGIGRTNKITTAEYFGVQAPAGAGSFGGMYINSSNATGLPFYGYSQGGVVTAYHYVDGNDSNKWKLTVGGGIRIAVSQNGNVGVGTSTPTTALQVNGTASASSFSGDGSGLTNIPASAVVPSPAPPAPAGMAFIPAGSFIMGETTGDSSDPDGYSTDAVPIPVSVSAFYMDTNLVSYGQWQSVYSYATAHGYDFDNAGTGKAVDHPVLVVSWFDTIKWCNARSQQAGLIPVYYTDSNFTHVYANGDVWPFVNWATNGYRLPTEAEWERAARGGLSGQRFPWGNAISLNLAQYHAGASWPYDMSSNIFNSAFTNAPYPYTSPVGYFIPNGYGLYDMAGNAYEWCWDWYGTPYPGGNDPRGASGPGSIGARVMRGGSWENGPDSLRCPVRWERPPSWVDYDTGFRCVKGH